MGACKAQVIDHREMLHILTQANATCVGTNGQVMFGSHQQHRQNFIDAA